MESIQNLQHDLISLNEQNNNDFIKLYYLIQFKQNLNRIKYYDEMIQ